MNSVESIAFRLKEVYLDGKWVAFTQIKSELDFLTYPRAIQRIETLHTPAELIFHLNYYLKGLLEAWETGELLIRDQFSFDVPPIHSEAQWESLKSEIMANANRFINRVEELNEDQLETDFFDSKYGQWRRNLEGVIEHSYYHLGQLVLIRKMIEHAEQKQ